VLKAPRLYGGLVHGGEVARLGTWTPILDRGTWEALQRLFADPTRRGGGAAGTHLLSGILRCGYPDCGAKLYYRRKPGRGTYDCPSPSQGGCGRISIDAGRVETWISDAALEAFDKPKFQAMLDATAGEADQARRATLGARLTKLETDQRECYDDYRVLGVIDRAQYLSANAKLEAEATDVRRQLDQLDRARLVLELPEGCSTLPEAWAVGDDAWKRKALRLALITVKVLPKVEGARPRFTPDRLDPDWRR
jgi:hypothetical protein